MMIEEERGGVWMCGGAKDGDDGNERVLVCHLTFV